jgi:hypothetical protein
MHSSQISSLSKLRTHPLHANFLQAFGNSRSTKRPQHQEHCGGSGDLQGSSFLGDLYPAKFNWSTNPLGMAGSRCNIVGSACVCFVDGEFHCCILMHPYATTMSASLLRATGTSQVAHRLGLLLHEMLHCFLGQHACPWCESSRRYRGRGHGRGFQLFAKAIEEHSMRLLGCKTDLTRLDSMLKDMKEGRNRSERNPSSVHRGASVHDMEVFGFLDSLA